MKVFIVSLRRDEFKRQIIEKRLKELEISFQFFDAVDGRELSSEQLLLLGIESFRRRARYDPTPGEIGCTLSHLGVFETFLRTEDEWCCILEDDVLLDNRFANFIVTANSTQLATDLEANEARILLLGGQEGLLGNQYLAVSNKKSTRVGGQNFRRILFSWKYVYRTCCYVVNREAAGRLLKLAKDGFFVADEWSFFKKAGAVESMYLADFVAHPIDLGASGLEAQRQVAMQVKSKIPISLRSKIKHGLKRVDRSGYLWIIKSKFLRFRSHIVAKFM